MRLVQLFGLVVAALSLAAAPAPDNRTGGEGGNATSKVEHSVDSIASAQNKIAAATDTGEYQKPCDNGQANDHSDLCAQWYAARAARDAADWAFYAMLVGIVGAVGIVIALALTMQSNSIARDTAKRQLRAYVHLKSADIGRCSSNNFPTDCDHPEQRFVDVEIQNYGQTPALNVVSVSAVGIKPFPPKEIRPLGEIPDWVERSTSDLPPGRESGMPMEVKASGHLHNRLMAGELAVYFWSQITYEDVFGEEHRTIISMVSHGNSFKRGCFTVAKEGNEAD